MTEEAGAKSDAHLLPPTTTHKTMARTRSVVPSTVLGSLFRLSTWLYLRLVPLHWAAKYILPTLLVSYFAALLSPWERAQLAPAPLQPTEPVGSIEPAYTDVKTEGAEDEETESKPVVPVKQPLVVVPSEPKLTVSTFCARRDRLLTALQPLNIARTVLFSLPTPSKPLALASVAINTLLFLFCLDFAYSPDFKSYDPTFSRVGAVDSSSAKILIRYPHLDEHQLRIVYRHVSPALFEVGWKDGPVIDIEEEKDFTAAAKLTGLWPSSKYECKSQMTAYMRCGVLINDSTTDKLAYLNSTLLPYPAEPIAFKTFPDPRMSSGVHFRFLASSCVVGLARPHVLTVTNHFCSSSTIRTAPLATKLSKDGIFSTTMSGRQHPTWSKWRRTRAQLLPTHIKPCPPPFPAKHQLSLRHYIAPRPWQALRCPAHPQWRAPSCPVHPALPAPPSQVPPAPRALQSRAHRPASLLKPRSLSNSSLNSCCLWVI